MASKPKLTFSMPTHQDALGVWPTVMSFIYHHSELLSQTELLIVDQAPESNHGAEVRKLVSRVQNVFHSAKYVGFQHPQGSAPAKEQCFKEASGEVVVVVDSHVLLLPGSLAKTLAYLEQDPWNRNLLSGPMIHDDLRGASTHLDDTWSGNQWGTWKEARICKCGSALEPGIHEGKLQFRLAHDLATWYEKCPRCANQVTPKPGTSLDESLTSSGFLTLASLNQTQVEHVQPFTVWAQGTGLLACKRSAWVGFTPGMKGFGGEEVLLHMRFRRRGYETLCLPWLRWSHRFVRPDGVKYNLSWYHHIRNYVLGFMDLGMHLAPVYEHFVSLDTKGESLDAHLVRAHGMNPASLQSVPEAEWSTIHQRKSFSPDLWQRILDGHEDPPPANQPNQAPSPDPSTFRTGTVEPGVSPPQDLAKKPCSTCGKQPTVHVPSRSYASVEAWYAHVLATQKVGIGYYAERLQALAEKYVLVTEFSRNPQVSSISLLHGVMELPDGKLVSVHPFRHADEKQLTELGSFKYVYYEGESIKTNIPETNLLFLDTVYTGIQLYQELKRYAPKVKYQIAVHGTYRYAEWGEGNTPEKPIPGLLVALREFMKEHPEWTVVEDYQAEMGLTVISRDPKDKQPLPSLVQMAGSFLKAKLNHAIRGKVASEEQFKRRLEICTLCPKRNNDRCGRCGCGLESKASHQQESCPLGYWAQHGV